MIINNDSLVVLPTIPDNSYDCCITDPPYSSAWVGKFYKILKKYQKNISLNKKRYSNRWNWGGIPGYWSEQFYKSSEEYEEFTNKWIKEIYRILLPGSFFACFGCNKLININVNISLSCGFLLKDTLIWKFTPSFSKGYSLKRIDKKSNHCNTMTANSYEPILLFQKPLNGNNENNYKLNKTGFIDINFLPSNIIEINKSKKKDNPHYSVKPLELMEKLCRGLMGRKIIDPFMGSGPLAIICQKLGLDYLGIELEEEFFNYVNNEINNI